MRHTYLGSGRFRQLISLSLSLAIMVISPAASLAGGKPRVRLGGNPASANLASLSNQSAASQTGFGAEAKIAISKEYGKLPLSFEANSGQHDSRVKFLARGGGCTLFLTASEAIMSFSSPVQNTKATPGQTSSAREARPDAAAATLRMNLVGADPRAKVTGSDMLPGKVNYLLGNDPKKWRSNIPTYAKVTYDDVYPGVDLVYYGNQEQLEYDLVVAPGASPEVIKLTFAGVSKPEVADNGELVLQTSGRPLRWSKPVVYQNTGRGRTNIEGRYLLDDDGGVRIKVGVYDEKKPLVIDPVLIYSTFLGGSSGEDIGNDIDVDSSGNAYVVGHTSSTDFWVENAFQSNHRGPSPSWWESAPYDVFVTKLNSTGTAIIYSTFLGGTDIEYGYSIRVGSMGEAYVSGATASANFPIVGKPKQPIKDIYLDAFMTRLSSDGSSIIYSTFYGGISNDYGYALDIGPTGLVYLAGRSYLDGFIAVINPDPECLDEVREHCEKQPPSTAYDDSDLVHSTTLGGNGSDIIRGLAVDSAGNAVVTGTTDSTNFPVTFNAIQGVKNSSVYLDAFVTKINANFTANLYSTYLGGSGQEYGLGVAVDSSGNAYVTGNTSSADFPTSSCALQNIYRGGIEDAFVIKLSSIGSMVYSTYLGGRTNSDIARAIAVDSSGNAYVTGTTASNDFPVTQGAYQTTFRSGPEDGFVTKLNAQGDMILYSTYIGDSGVDHARSIALDSSNNVYITGNTVSANFPTTATSVQPTYRGDGTFGLEGDAFVAKLSLVTDNPADDGPHTVMTAEYQFDDMVDPDIIAGRMTELWARVYWPSGFAGGPRPLVLFLHGNHGTCGVLNPPNPRDDNQSAYFDGYAQNGVCPSGSVVVPSHEGYAYLANKLASWGYVVVSINANRGINALAGPSGDSFLIGARGNLVLKHLQRLSEWNGSNAAFVRTKTYSGWRNNQSAWLGMKITTGPQDIVVRSLGRLWAYSNTGTHTVKIVKASDGTDVASVAVSMTGGVDGQFKYGTLSSPVTLTKNTNYYIVSQEVSGGDYWHESNTVRTAGVATTGGRVVSTDGINWTVSGTVDQVYGPLDFTYDVPTPSTLGIDLQGKLDFTNVGMMGHSRGGEGVRAAYTFYQEATDTSAAPWKRYIAPVVNFRAIFEIAPTDQIPADQTRMFKATATKWNVLLPMCDGDVNDLQGVNPFDRMMLNASDNRNENPPTQKSTYTVWGANHNFYNTEWQVSDSSVCLDHTPLFPSSFGSSSQRQTALDSLVPFFRANVGTNGDLSLNQRFDTRYKLPVAVTGVTRIERGFTPTTKSYLTTIVEDFDKPYPQNSSGNLNDVGTNLSVVYGAVLRHDPSLLAGIMQWTTSGANAYFQSNWTAPGSGVNVYGNETLDFRITRLPSSSLNPSNPTNFSIQLVMANGTLSQPVKLCSYINLIGPVGGPLGRHPILQTVRIPLGDFRETDVLQVRGVRFVFDETSSGLIAIANVRFAR